MGKYSDYITERSMQLKKYGNLFFKPFNDSFDFGLNLFTPVAFPLLFAIYAVHHAGETIVLGAGAFACLFVAAVTVPFDDSIATVSAVYAWTFAIFAVDAIVGFVENVIKAVLSPLLQLIQIVTRSAATVANALNLLPSDEELLPSEEEQVLACN